MLCWVEVGVLIILVCYQKWDICKKQSSVFSFWLQNWFVTLEYLSTKKEHKSTYYLENQSIKNQVLLKAIMTLFIIIASYLGILQTQFCHPPMLLRYKQPRVHRTVANCWRIPFQAGILGQFLCLIRLITKSAKIYVEQQGERRAKKAAMLEKKHRRIAKFMADQVELFWQSISRLVADLFKPGMNCPK